MFGAPETPAIEAMFTALDTAGFVADAAIINAATNPVMGPLLDIELDAWRKILDVNLTGALWTARCAARRMKPGGSIVFMASVAGLEPIPGLGAYSTSKAGLLGLMRALARELGPAGIRVNAVRPGLVPTDLASGLVNNPAANADYLDQMPLRRLGTTDDIANIVRFLIGPESSWVTGQVIAADGGHTLRRGPDLDPLAKLAMKADQRHPYAG